MNGLSECGYQIRRLRFGKVLYRGIAACKDINGFPSHMNMKDLQGNVLIYSPNLQPGRSCRFPLDSGCNHTEASLCSSRASQRTMPRRAMTSAWQSCRISPCFGSLLNGLVLLSVRTYSIGLYLTSILHPCYIVHFANQQSLLHSYGQKDAPYGNAFIETAI